MIRKLWLAVLIFSVAPAAFASPQPGQELWKGTPYEQVFSFAALNGVGILNGRAGYGINGYIGFKILHEGFVNDINDQVHLEFLGGPLFVSGGTAFNLAAWMRWDFHKDEMWTFYGAGGLGTLFSGASLGNLTRIFPRVGIGAMWRPLVGMSFRMEVTGDFIGLGIAVQL